MRSTHLQWPWHPLHPQPQRTVSPPMRERVGKKTKGEKEVERSTCVVQWHRKWVVIFLLDEKITVVYYLTSRFCSHYYSLLYYFFIHANNLNVYRRKWEWITAVRGYICPQKRLYQNMVLSLYIVIEITNKYLILFPINILLLRKHRLSLRMSFFTQNSLSQNIKIISILAHFFIKTQSS